jgi:hypothetical protein
VYAKQNDLNSRFLKIRIQEGGKDITVDPTSRVILNVERPDHSEDMFYCSVNSDGTVKVLLNSWMLELAGGLSCDISVIKQEPSELKYTTMKFNIFVEDAAVSDDKMVETEEYSVIVDLLTRATTKEPLAEEAAKRAEDAAIRAEYAADNVVTIKGINQTSPSGLVDTYEVELTNGVKHPFKVTNGKNGDTPVKNKDYFDGYTPQKNVDYFDGVGIKEIAKTRTVGLVDTHTITLTDGRTYDFTVTNGSGGGSVPEDVYTYINASLSVSPSSVEYADAVTGVEIEWSVTEEAEYITLTLPDGSKVNLKGKQSPYIDPNRYLVTSPLTWQLDAKRAGGKEEEAPTKYDSINYHYLVYWGVGNKEDYTDPNFMNEVNKVYDESFLKGLKSEKTTFKSRTLSFTSIDSQYVYYVIPENLCKNSDGTISEPIFQLGEFPVPGAFEPKETITVTKNDISIVYYLYRSTNLLENDVAFNVYVK